MGLRAMVCEERSRLSLSIRLLLDRRAYHWKTLDGSNPWRTLERTSRLLFELTMTKLVTINTLPTCNPCPRLARPIFEYFDPTYRHFNATNNHGRRDTNLSKLSS